MRWSKLKQLIEEGFADCVRGRVELWTTRYVKADDRYGRSWITIDGKEIINMANRLPIGEAFADGHPHRHIAGVFAGYDLPMAMREFLGLSIDRAMASENPLLRALAALDRRTGVRLMARLAGDESPLVQLLIDLRRSAKI